MGYTKDGHQHSPENKTTNRRPPSPCTAPREREPARHAAEGREHDHPRLASLAPRLAATHSKNETPTRRHAHRKRRRGHQKQRCKQQLATQRFCTSFPSGSA